jgi:hypothetical protein
LARENSTSSPLKRFPHRYGSELPSMMEFPFHESNGGSGMHGFCVILIFLTVCKYGVMFLWDDYKMLIIVRIIMGIIEYKGCTLVIFSINVIFYDGSLWNNGDNGEIKL